MEPGRQGVPPAVRPLPESLASDWGTGSCPAFPRFPDEECTGYRHTGVSLEPCPNRIEDDGVTLDGCRFSRNLTVVAENVTITRSLVEGRVLATSGTDWSLGNLRLVDVEIDGGGEVVPDLGIAIGQHDYTCIRCHIHGTGRGAHLGNNVHVEDSYLHDWVYTDGAHQTAMSSHAGSNYVVLHNNLVCNHRDGCSAAFALYPDFGPVDDVLVRNNLFNAHGHYCVYGGWEATNVRFIDNRFGKMFAPTCGRSGPVEFFQYNEGNVWRGNEWQDGSGEVLPPTG